MPTYADIALNVLTLAGYDHDDANRNLEGALFALEMAIDTVKRQRIEKEVNSGSGSRGVTDMACTYIVPIQTENYVNGRAYFKLPSDVYDIKLNGGIEYIAYHDSSGCRENLIGKHFTLCTPSELDMLQNSPVQRPSERNPYYYRARINTGAGGCDDRVWLIGISPNISSVEILIYLTSGLSDAQFDPNQEVNLPADMIGLVTKMMLDMERWAMMVPQERMKNDGRDWNVGQRPIQAPREVSINHPANIAQ